MTNIPANRPARVRDGRELKLSFENGRVFAAAPTFAGQSKTFIVNGTEYPVVFDALGNAEFVFTASKSVIRYNVRMKVAGNPRSFNHDRLVFWH